MKRLIFLFSFFLISCSSSPDQSPKVNNVALNIFHVFDVTKHNNDTYIFSWLSRSKSKPLRLAQFTLKGEEKISQEIYQWADGDEYFQKIKISAEKEAIPQYIPDLSLEEKTHLDLNIRFADKGEVVFQKIFLNNRYYQFNSNNLRYLKNNADKEAERLKDRNRGELRIYQGFWKNGVFIDCDGQREYDVSFVDDAIVPDSNFVIVRAYLDESLLFGSDALEDANIIWQSTAKQQCFKAPE